MIEEETKGNGLTGLIPDFFHDVIAYLIPGFTVVCLIFFNVYVATKEVLIKPTDLGVAGFFFIFIIAYVVGRFLEQVGYDLIHHKKFPFFGENCEETGPKWSLLFDDSEKFYTTVFKNNLTKKIEELLDKQDGSNLMKECKDTKRDDYFNLIQFYLRERFPSVALYEKKQNATIVLTRSLCIGFFFNIVIFLLALYFLGHLEQIKHSHKAILWITLNLIFAIVFYSRFLLDKKYHAMYIYETFISMKKLLTSQVKGPSPKVSDD